MSAAYLLDVNVLIALFDSAHVHHDAAHAWFEQDGSSAWATCPITENGFVRVLSNPRYPGRRTTAADAAERLARFASSARHRFWADQVSVLDRSAVDVGRIGGHREVTDAYLLALAVKNGGRLATFDRNVRVEAVVGANHEDVRVLG